MDIGSGQGYPSSALSNFSPHPFVIDGIECASMEGWLQSLKYSNPDMQIEVCKLVGKAAKFKGKQKNWYQSQTLWWRGTPIDRRSQDYQDLLDKAYLQLAKNEGFRKALLATNDAVLTHEIGKNDESRTVLTKREFCSRLTKLREKIKNKEI